MKTKNGQILISVTLHKQDFTEVTWEKLKRNTYWYEVDFVGDNIIRIITDENNYSTIQEMYNLNQQIDNNRTVIELFKIQYKAYITGINRYEILSTISAGINKKNALKIFRHSISYMDVEILNIEKVDQFTCPNKYIDQYVGYDEIILHHHRNRKTFERHYPDAKFIGYSCGYYNPTYLVKMFDINKLPKSCTINSVNGNNMPLPF